MLELDASIIDDASRNFLFLTSHFHIFQWVPFQIHAACQVPKFSHFWFFQTHLEHQGYSVARSHFVILEFSFLLLNKYIIAEVYYVVFIVQYIIISTFFVTPQTSHWRAKIRVILPSNLLWSPVSNFEFLIVIQHEYFWILYPNHSSISLLLLFHLIFFHSSVTLTSLMHLIFFRHYSIEIGKKYFVVTDRKYISCSFFQERHIFAMFILVLASNFEFLIVIQHVYFWILYPNHSSISLFLLYHLVPLHFSFTLTSLIHLIFFRHFSIEIDNKYFFVTDREFIFRTLTSHP